MSPYCLLAVLALVLYLVSGQQPNCPHTYIRKGLATDCETEFAKTTNPATIPTIDFDVLCVKTCIGAAVNFARYNCSNPLLADIWNIGCFKDTGLYGNHCLLVIEAHASGERVILESAGSNCITGGTTCSADCVNALKLISTDMGCCFMAYFGNKVLVNELVQNKTFTTDQQQFFAKLSDPQLWNNCQVPQPSACNEY